MMLLLPCSGEIKIINVASALFHSEARRGIVGKGRCRPSCAAGIMERVLLIQVGRHSFIRRRRLT